MLRERGFKIEVVAIALNWEGASRADTVLGNPARDPRPSEYDAGIRREIESIEEVHPQRGHPPSSERCAR